MGIDQRTERAKRSRRAILTNLRKTSFNHNGVAFSNAFLILGLMEDVTKGNSEPASERKQLALKLYQKHFGNISKVCRKIGICRLTFYRWKENDAEFAKAINEIEFGEDLLDLAEQKMVLLIKGFKYEEEEIIHTNTGKITKKKKKMVLPSERMIEFFLRSKGNKRGYGDANDNDQKHNAINDIEKRERILDEMIKKAKGKNE